MTEDLLNQVLQNQAIIYAKIMKVEDKLKGMSTTSDHVDDAQKKLSELRKKYFSEHK